MEKGWPGIVPHSTQLATLPRSTLVYRWIYVIFLLTLLFRLFQDFLMDAKKGNVTKLCQVRSTLPLVDISPTVVVAAISYAI